MNDYGDVPFRLTEHIRGSEKGKRDLEDDEDDLLYETELEHSAIRQRNLIMTKLKRYAEDELLKQDEQFRSEF